jgi:hypothetical protein
MITVNQDPLDIQGKKFSFSTSKVFNPLDEVRVQCFDEKLHSAVVRALFVMLKMTRNK